MIERIQLFILAFSRWNITLHLKEGHLISSDSSNLRAKMYAQKGEETHETACCKYNEVQICCLLPIISKIAEQPRRSSS